MWTKGTLKIVDEKLFVKSEQNYNINNRNKFELGTIVLKIRSFE